LGELEKTNMYSHMVYPCLYVLIFIPLSAFAVLCHQNAGIVHFCWLIYEMICLYLINLIQSYAHKLKPVVMVTTEYDLSYFIMMLICTLSLIAC